MNLTSKTQIDRLGDRLRKGTPTEDDLERLDEYRRSFAEAYEEVVSLVRKTTQLEPTGRLAKTTTSIIEKLQRETMRLSQMQDIAGCRLVVRDIAKQDQVVARLTAVLLPEAVVVDRRMQPSHGYRAVHVIATVQGKPIEIQVRTELQDLWAQLSEQLSDMFDPAIKYGGGDAKAQRLMPNLSAHIADMEVSESQLSSPEYRSGGAAQLQRIQVQLAKEFASVKEQFLRELEDLIAKLGVSLGKQPGD